MPNQERRKYPRIEKEVPFKLFELDIHAPRDLIRTHSININKNGVYCKVNRFIPVFTQVQLIFEVACDSPKGKSKKRETTLFCEGTVVRSELERRGIEKEYRVAIYSENIPEATLQTLKEG